MFNKPFKPPSLTRPSDPKSSSLSSVIHKQPSVAQPPPKRPRIGSGQLFSKPVVSLRSSLGGDQDPARAPPSGSAGSTVSASGTPSSSESDLYFNVLWRKFTLKKNKTWDGDGILVVQAGYAHLHDEDGREMGKCLCPKGIGPGTTMSVGGKDVEVCDQLAKEEYLSGRVFLKSSGGPPAAPASRSTQLHTNGSFPLSTPKSAFQHPKRVTPVSSATGGEDRVGATVAAEPTVKVEYLPNPASKIKPFSTSKFKSPVINNTVQAPADANDKRAKPVPRHDPNAPGALVMKRPTSVPKGKQIVDVVMDPILSRHLREHQREGVKFMYECVMGMKDFDGEGCILADEMGLGKTLQTIALLWTLMKQNPIANSPPVVRKAVVVCPVSLVNNWRKEFRKWLGNERIGVFVPDDNRWSRITDFTMGRVYNVMIVGYEKIRTLADELARAPGIDIVIADEGHRLKTAQNKSALAIKMLNTARRVILSGTPIQNDLSEFFTMVDFVNPGLLGKYAVFKREFETPIVKSRQPNATKKETEKGHARAQELTDLTSLFILRRTADILSKYLPPKTEYVFFCPPTAPQAALYKSIVSSPLFSTALGSPESALQLINLLRKACSSPSLLVCPKTKSGYFGFDTGGTADGEKGSSADVLSEQMQEWVLPQINPSIQRQLQQPMACSKVRVLDRLLHLVRTTTDEKVVLVSNWTSTLDILGSHLSAQSFSFLRLDGSTPPAKRQSLVDQFNRSSQDDHFVFLLSAKAGGVGLNLIGASRLVLFDIDWNPSVDLQTMARIHRDGQRRHCHVYRFLTMGALDEKVFQRQVTKQGLADRLVDKKDSAPSFTRDELRDLFGLDESGVCRTHELIGCGCGGRGNLDSVVPALSPVDGGEPSGSAGGGGDGLFVSGEDEDEDHEGEGEEQEGQDDDDLPDLPTIMSAAKVDMAELEAKIATRKRKAVAAKMQRHALMRYIHFDNSAAGAAAAVAVADGSGGEDGATEDGLGPGDDPVALADQLFDDPVTIKVLGEPDCRVKYVFSRTV